MKKIVLLVSILTGLRAVAQNSLNIVPMPAEVKMRKGNFMLSSSTKIILQGSNLEKTAAFLNNYIKKNYGFALKVQKDAAIENTIVLNYERMDKPIAGAYIMDINKNEIYIAGDNEAGVFYGIQTFLQLLPINKKTSSLKNYSLSIPQLSITDYPRFAYRGMHLDVGRHFFPISFIKKYIDYLAAYKFNTFHWHLTEDQGWRIEIKKYPLLTKVGGYRNGTIIGRYPGKGNDSIHYGGFYTQAQIKDIVKYATDRHIDVIPEIEMPGHSSAAIAAYPQLSCFPEENTEILKSTPWAGSRTGKQVQQTWGVFNDVFAPTEYTFNFLQDVIDEVIQLFPSKYIHIGGDECPKENWKRSPFCQQLIKDNNLKDEHGLQSYFIQRIEKYINSKGKKIIGWDEILEGGIAPNATIMSWRGEEGGITAAKENHDVIMTPGTYCYLDHSQSKNEDSVTIGGYLPLEKVYGYEPIPPVLNAEQAKHVLGAQGNVWTEYMSNPSKVEYMIFPRMSALSEVLWSPKEKRNWKDFERRLPVIFKMYESWKANYSKAYYDLKATVLPTEDYNGVLWELNSKVDNKISVLKVFSETFDSISERQSFFVYDKKGNVIGQKDSTGIKDYYSEIYTNPIRVNKTKLIAATLEDTRDVHSSFSRVEQSFHFNKATGKKITIVNPPSKSYPGDGAFTLVNGVQNEKGLSKSGEFLGFNGTDLDATIDLGKITDIKKVTLHVLEQPGSWIYLPVKVEITYLQSLDLPKDGTAERAKVNSINIEQGKGLSVIEITGQQSCRYIHVIAKNLGIISQGNAGAGNPAWLFVDEIEVE